MRWLQLLDKFEVLLRALSSYQLNVKLDLSKSERSLEKPINVLLYVIVAQTVKIDQLLMFSRMIQIFPLRPINRFLAGPLKAPGF
jgi:hypothetical protein